MRSILSYGLLATALMMGGGWWWFSQANAPTAENTATESTIESATETATDESATSTDANERQTNSPGTDALMELMQKDDGLHYQDALDEEVIFLPTSDGKSFYAFWTPPDFDPEKDGFVVAFHGHDDFVSGGFSAWKPYLEEYNYGYIGVQWWFGGGETIEDYYNPKEMLAETKYALAEQGIPGGKLLLEGFSRAATNMYAVEAMDHASENPLFILTIANSGGAAMSYPPTKEVDNGLYGETPFAETHWILFCGEKDTTEPASGANVCESMALAKTWVENLGGTIDLFIQDPNQGHGGFHLNPDNTRAALDIYERLRTL